MPKLSKRDAPMLNDSDVRELIAKTEQHETKALIALLYLFGCRISEALSLTRGDFETANDYLYVTLPVLKEGKQGLDFPRHLYVKIDNEFVSIITSMVNKISETEPKKRVFNFGRKTAWKRIKKVFPEGWPHLFRHIRATAFSNKGKNENQLCAWFGWRKRDTARTYVRLSQETIKGMGDDI